MSIWRGFPTVGFSHPVPCCNSQDAPFISTSVVLQDGRMDAVAVVGSLRPSPWDEEILKAGVEDEAKRHCRAPMSWDDLFALKRPFRLIRHSCIQQASGKLRVIDDANDGG